MGRKWLDFGCAGTDRIPILCTADENLFTVLRAGEMRIQSVPFLKSKRRFRLSLQRFMPKLPIIELTSFGDALSFP